MPSSTVWYLPVYHTGQKFNNSGKEFTINNDISRKTRNLILVITCSGCGELYIGETGNTLRERIRIHKQQINSSEYRKIKLSEDLDVCGQNFFYCFPLL